MCNNDCANGTAFMDIKQKILELIEKDAKMSVESISHQIGVPVDVIIQTLGEMETDRIICGYNTIIDWDKVSTEKVGAIIEVRCLPQRGVGFDKIGMRIARFDEVDSIYLLSGSYDFLIRIKARSMREVSQFVFEKLSTLELVQGTTTHFILKKYKDHGLVMDEEDKEEMRSSVIL